MREVGDLLHITGERVRQISESIIKKLRKVNERGEIGMLLTKGDIYAISKRAKESIAQGIVDYQEEILKAEIFPGNRLNMFLAQLAHESDGFKTTREYASGAAYEGRSDLGNTS